MGHHGVGIFWNVADWTIGNLSLIHICFEAVIAYIYEYFSEFKLLITGAPGNYYQEFLEGLVQLDTDCTCLLYTSLYQQTERDL